ncbi:WD repeat-containing protein 61 [Carex littledalei]|uniref:WD repeat-containing protein 61 n=1 Tax=Carex littledalei TaxID=544730 RepID=A0A833RD88_9POAL|nr:WD repeat-containing protein 61 [Carex littledalei]
MKLSGIKSAESCHDDSIWAAAWVPPSTSRATSLLLTGSLDESVRLWHSDDLSSAAPPSRGHSLGVVSLAAHPSGSLAAATSLDSLVRVFDVDTAASVALLEAAPSEAWGLQFNPKGTLLAVAGGGSATVKLWDTATWQLVDTLAVPRPEGARPDRPAPSGIPTGNFILAVAWSPDGRRLACSSYDGSVAVFDTARAKLLHHLSGHHMPVRSLVFSPVDPRVLFTGSDDSHVHMYDADGRSLVAAMSGHAGGVSSVDASPDGAALATGSADRTVRLWDVGMRAAVQTMANHTDHVWGVAFRPDTSGAGTRAAGRLASVSDDRSISLYDHS